MPDIVDPLTRSRMMAGIRGKDTKPELLVRHGLHALGFRYRLDARDIPGRPDLALPRYRATIFVHGCFWHGHDCALFRAPDTRAAFWSEKIEGNRRRDQVVAEKLADEGWRQLTIWECAFRGRGSIGLPTVLERASNWIAGTESTGEIRGMV